MLSVVRSLRTDHNVQLLNGLVFVALFASVAFHLVQTPLLTALGISPLIVGIVVGMCYGNTLHVHMPAYLKPGILFSSKSLLRLAIILYGFRLTFQDLAQVGFKGAALAVFMLGSTFLMGSWLGIRVFRLPHRLALLTAAGSSICGAAAVLAMEPVVKAENHESSIAVGTVVVFGTLAMLLYPLLFSHGLLPMSAEMYGAFAGATLHEVAHAVAAGQAVSSDAGNIAVIVKMMRVIMLAPLLVILGFWLRRRLNVGQHDNGPDASPMKSFPWFAVLFVVVIGINSLGVIPHSVVNAINAFDIFLLTMAMCALGMETSLEKVRKVGPRPFLLAALLAVWLGVGGFFAANFFIG